MYIVGYNKIIFSSEIVKKIITDLAQSVPEYKIGNIKWINVNNEQNYIDIILSVDIEQIKLINAYNFCKKIKDTIYYKICILSKVYKDLLKVNIKMIANEKNGEKIYYN